MNILEETVYGVRADGKVRRRESEREENKEYQGRSTSLDFSAPK